MEFLKIGLVVVAGIMTASGLASIYFRRDNTMNWVVVLAMVWMVVLFAYTVDMGDWLD